MKIYLCSRYQRFPEMQLYAAKLEKLGHTIVSTWINGAHQNANDDESAWAQFAAKDMADLSNADCVVAFTEYPDSGYSRGGRHVELGMALAWGKLVWVVGHIENIFCTLPEVNYVKTVGDLLVEIGEA